MRPLATDTHDFPKIRNEGKIYVDKTMFIHRLITDRDANLFFVSRPRRFGKSLTVSALKAIFSGRRELFEGLQSLYAAMAYGSTERRVHENSYGRCLSFLLASCGFRFRMEAVQSNGSADVVAEHPAEVCIFELKVDEPVDRAFAQIRGKGYAEPFKADARPVWLIGLSFDSTTRQLVDFAAEQVRQHPPCNRMRVLR
jgi:hypothetical protein